ncbi:hypothetical protein ABFS82_08G192500 [Erythranthe guttata]|uniref:uncharacterized protein LOC105970452 n=1 Tax=Erythranthe guttata TaxID=4155 RepID=UPI00064DA4C3|nr:PREDICTED: uncharacterized protein LOC105970452 [Erythranthe guttata]|eukprot:XP_012850729.1 PREDICTED: uncharacterized protein LOC105970452 [Erythranthe guttata]
MEKMGDDRRAGEELKYRNAIRCAKVATLLSSLRNATANSTSKAPQLQDEGKVEMLKIQLVKNKMKMKKLQRWIGMSLLVYFVFLLIFPFVLNFTLDWLSSI